MKETGLISEYVTVIPTGKKIKYYQDKGYQAVAKKPLVVSVDDLPPTSNVNVYVQCVFCKEVKSVSYKIYMSSISSQNYYSCMHCNHLKASQTMLEKTGYPNALKNPEIRQKMKEHNLEVYGVEHVMKLPEIAQKVQDTWMKHYNVVSPFQSPEMSKKIREKCFEEYGVENYVQAEEIKEKINKTMYANGTVRTSSQQKVIYNIYKQKYSNTKLNYPIGKKFSGDIIVDNLDIEVDYGGHNLSVKRGNMTQEEFDYKQMIRDKIVKSEGYKIIRIVAEKERKIPSDQILLDILSRSKQYFADYPNHSWIEWNIDTGAYYNAEHKSGIPYDYGDLRTIKIPEIQQSA